jgi:predicted  nucleic acid-binding Zn-ribbon protein
MRRLAIVLSLCVLAGCDARTEVAKKKALEKIDSLLGSMDVKRKEVELSMKALKTGVDGIRKAKIKAQVKHDQIGQRAEPFQARIAQADTTLKKLRDYLVSNEAVEISGKEYSPDQLKKMANDVIAARKSNSDQVAGFDKSQANLKKVVTTLEKRQREYEARIVSLEGQIAQIDTQAVALKAMKDASASMGDADTTLDQNVTNLEDKVNDLFAETQAELLGEGEKWDATAADTEINSVDAFIKATQEPTDTISEIDKILGDGK